jgi:hypothetical protein
LNAKDGSLRWKLVICGNPEAPDCTHDDTSKSGPSGRPQTTWFAVDAREAGFGGLPTPQRTFWGSISTANPFSGARPVASGRQARATFKVLLLLLLDPSLGVSLRLIERIGPR